MRLKASRDRYLLGIRVDASTLALKWMALLWCTPALNDLARPARLMGGSYQCPFFQHSKQSRISACSSTGVGSPKENASMPAALAGAGAVAGGAGWAWRPRARKCRALLKNKSP